LSFERAEVAIPVRLPMLARFVERGVCQCGRLV
jgi:hypothetical protein